MYPAFSVIFFTTASGAGYGLLVWLGVFGALGILPAERWFGVTAFVFAFALVTAGLLSSTFHLGHPERAWRALTQWKTSWLSREGVTAMLTYIPTGLYAIGWVLLERNGGVFAALGLAGAVLCLATVYCTAMIYASLKSIERWSNKFVPPVYVALGVATGCLLLTLLAHIFGHASSAIDAVALAALAVATFLKLAYWKMIRKSRSGSTAASATGLGKPGLVRLLDAPHTESNYLLQEMGYRVARKHADRLRVIAAMALFAVPLVLLVAAALAHAPIVSTFLLAVAVASAAAGVVLERWLFFAEAKHTVTLYYGAENA
jgi:DMSO reductase anchor subunit